MAFFDAAFFDSFFDIGDTPPTPTPSTGGGGGGHVWPGRRKGKSRQEVLFERLENTIRDLVSPKVHIGTENVILPEKVIDFRLEKAIRELSDLAKRDADLTVRFSMLKREIADYKEFKRQQEIDDDDDDFFFMSD